MNRIVCRGGNRYREFCVQKRLQLEYGPNNEDSLVQMKSFFRKDYLGYFARMENKFYLQNDAKGNKQAIQQGLGPEGTTDFCGSWGHFSSSVAVFFNNRM